MQWWQTDVTCSTSSHAQRKSWNEKQWGQQVLVRTQRTWRESEMGQLLWKMFLKKLNIYHVTQQSCSWAFVPGRWKLCPHNKVYTHGHSSFLCDSPKLKTPGCSSVSDRLTIQVHPRSGPLAPRQRRAGRGTSTWKASCWGKNPASQGYIPVIAFTWHFQNDKIMEVEAN